MADQFPNVAAVREFFKTAPANDTLTREQVKQIFSRFRINDSPADAELNNTDGSWYMLHWGTFAETEPESYTVDDIKESLNSIEFHYRRYLDTMQIELNIMKDYITANQTILDECIADNFISLNNKKKWHGRDLSVSAQITARLDVNNYTKLSSGQI